jgi:PleD family two-component response regulator
MQESINILIIGTNQPIVKTIERLINNNDNWKASKAYTVEQAFDSCKKENFKLILIGAGITEMDEQLLKQKLNMPIVKHYGGGSGLLFAEIYEVLNKAK